MSTVPQGTGCCSGLLSLQLYYFVVHSYNYNHLPKPYDVSFRVVVLAVSFHAAEVPATRAAVTRMVFKIIIVLVDVFVGEMNVVA